MTGLCWVLAIGAVWRLTLLIVADEITHPARVRARKLWPSEGFAYWLSCTWCVPPWIAPPIVASGLAWSDGWGWQLVTGSLAASAVVGFLSTFASPDG